ncbi:hypothetical protein HIM_01583 [Hirsutella minnesotensis 3608]|nr:hypothetical protein HIM_01583 [Hirsutella minnesotensis 3608]
MDLAYNQHSERARRKNRSSPNINHLTLAPLTVKLPLNDGDDFVDPQAHYYGTSYLQGKSAPTTPRLLSHSTTPKTPRSRSQHRLQSTSSASIKKSVSSSHLAPGSGRRPTSGTATPRRRKDDGMKSRDANDSDWLLRAGALMSSEAREYKGQAWLVSRQSSTSLTGMRDAEEEAAFEMELAREREMASRHASRRGSSALADDDVTPNGSRFPSRFHSRSHSMAESRSHVVTPLELANSDTADGSYFPGHDLAIAGPDFVNLDEKLEELELDTTQEDEATVRRLVRRGQAGKGSWISNVIGWSLFSVDEDEEDSADENESEDDEAEGEGLMDGEMLLRDGRNVWAARHFEGVGNMSLEQMPPPAKDEGGWKDAAWLLSVASKVVF